MEPKQPGVATIQVLTRSSDILQLLKKNPTGLAQIEIAQRLGLARSTAQRILTALVDINLLDQNQPDKRYRIGSEIILLAEAARGGVISEFHHYLKELSIKVEETVDLSVLENGGMRFIDQVMADQRLRVVSAVGGVFPLHSTANGKAALAELSDDEVRNMLPTRLPMSTHNTIRSRKTLLNIIGEIRALGVATDIEEHSLGTCAVSVALRGTPFGICAISIPIPAQRFSKKRKLAEAALFSTVREIEGIFRQKSL